MNQPIDKSNILLYAARHYDGSMMSMTADFYADFARPKQIKKLLNRYRKTGELKERLILNHFIVFYNTFNNEAATRILCFSLREYLSEVKTFLVFLNRWPERVDLDPPIIGSDIPIVPEIANVLRQL